METWRKWVEQLNDAVTPKVTVLVQSPRIRPPTATFVCVTLWPLLCAALGGHSAGGTGGGLGGAPARCVVQRSRTAYAGGGLGAPALGAPPGRAPSKSASTTSPMPTNSATEG